MMNLRDEHQHQIKAVIGPSFGLFEILKGRQKVSVLQGPGAHLNSYVGRESDGLITL